MSTDLLQRAPFWLCRSHLFIILGTPRSLDYSKVQGMLRDVPGVMMVHSLHIWSLNVDKHCLTAHLAVGKNI